jgi:hypothetical protein
MIPSKTLADNGKMLSTLNVYVPDVANLATGGVKSALWHGELYIWSHIDQHDAELSFTYQPAEGNPLLNKPILQESISLYPSRGIKRREPGTTEMAIEMNKRNFIPILRKDERWQIMHLMAGWMKIPISDLLFSTGEGIYLNKNAKNEWWLAADIAQPKRMKGAMQRMETEGILKRDGANGYTGVESKVEVQKWAGLMTLGNRRMEEGPSVSRYEGYGLRAKIAQQDLKTIANLAKLGDQTLVKPVLAAAEQMEISISNEANGSFRGEAVLYHHLDIFAMASAKGGLAVKK